MRCLPEAAPGLKAVAQDGLAWLDGQLGDRAFLAGDRFTYADINLFSFLDFGVTVGQPLDPALTKVTAWHARVKERPSTAASA
jgi:glutathione S-transferase